MAYFRFALKESVPTYTCILTYCSLCSNKMKDEGALILVEALASNETVNAFQ